MLIEDSVTMNEDRNFNLTDNIWYVTTIKDNEIVTLPVKITSSVIAQGRGYSTRYYILSYEVKIFKSFLHKWFDKQTIEYKPLNIKVLSDFVKKTPEEAELSYYNIMHTPHKDFTLLVKKRNEFINKNPDIFLNKMVNYNGISMSHPPKLFGDMEYNGFEVTRNISSN